MVNSLLDDVNELLRLSYGDENRLEDIKRRLEDGLTIYNSDINYLKKLVEQHKNEIQETAESESTTTEPELLPVDDELEELEEEETQKKHSGSNLKKMGFGILVTAAVISVFFAIGSVEEKGWISSDEPITNIPNEILEERNNESTKFQKLKESAVDLIYEDLRLIYATDVSFTPPRDVIISGDNYLGEIAHIEAKVEYVGEQYNNYISVNVLSNSKYELNDESFRPFEYRALVKLVNSDHNWKVGDVFSGYIKVLPYSEFCRVLYPVDGYFPKGGFITKFDGDTCYDVKNVIHFEEIQIMRINSPTLEKEFERVIEVLG